MQCKSCGYPLWNLSQRCCPECGRAYSVREYFYRRGTVRFRCPHCRGEQPPATSRGLPRDARPCTGCGREVIVDEMVVEPADRGQPFPALPIGVDSHQHRQRRKREYNIALIVLVIFVVVWIGSTFFPFFAALLF